MSWTHALPTLKLLKAAQTYLLVSALRVTTARMELNVFHALLALTVEAAILLPSVQTTPSRQVPQNPSRTAPAIQVTTALARLAPIVRRVPTALEAPQSTLALPTRTALPAAHSFRNVCAAPAILGIPSPVPNARRTMFARAEQALSRALPTQRRQKAAQTSRNASVILDSRATMEMYASRAPLTATAWEALRLRSARPLPRHQLAQNRSRSAPAPSKRSIPRREARQDTRQWREGQHAKNTVHKTWAARVKHVHCATVTPAAEASFSPRVQSTLLHSLKEKLSFSRAPPTAWALSKSLVTANSTCATTSHLMFGR